MFKKVQKAFALCVLFSCAVASAATVFVNSNISETFNNLADAIITVHVNGISPRTPQQDTEGYVGPHHIMHVMIPAQAFVAEFKEDIPEKFHKLLLGFNWIEIVLNTTVSDEYLIEYEICQENPIGLDEILTHGLASLHNASVIKVLGSVVMPTFNPLNFNTDKKLKLTLSFDVNLDTEKEIKVVATSATTEFVTSTIEKAKKLKNKAITTFRKTLQPVKDATRSTKLSVQSGWSRFKNQFNSKHLIPMRTHSDEITYGRGDLKPAKQNRK